MKRIGFLAAISAAACLLMAISAQRHSVVAAAQVPSAKDVVAPSAYASFDPAARGQKLQLAVVLKIRQGYHINARKPTLDYLIPTDLKVQTPAGLQAGEVSYPQGHLRAFAFSKSDKLNVYEGNTILRVPITVSADAPTGAQTIPLKLRYQACSNEVCLPPVTLQLSATVHVAAAPSAAKPAHRELFPKS